VIATLLLTLAVPSSAGAADQDLMKRWYGENELCRGSSDQTTIDRECPKRDATGAELKRRGWCWAYSDVSVPPPEYAWHRCSEPRPPEVIFHPAADEPQSSVVPAATRGLDAAVFGGLGTILILLTFYLLPTIVAALRRHRNAPAIAVLNILAGWTLIGWVGALVWSLYRDAPRS